MKKIYLDIESSDLKYVLAVLKAAIGADCIYYETKYQLCEVLAATFLECRRRVQQSQAEEEDYQRRRLEALSDVDYRDSAEGEAQ
ncbi:MAG: hypothetical protein GTN64_05585 [Candidatus Latescibacteria bacterium]|nr:hypothetical protein [Candidatus Latescibacterota bacterium]NIO78081.1 hypothetical protein [Candidatus Latescibacterota bacterium]